MEKIILRQQRSLIQLAHLSKLISVMTKSHILLTQKNPPLTFTCILHPFPSISCGLWPSLPLLHVRDLQFIWVWRLWIKAKFYSLNSWQGQRFFLFHVNLQNLMKTSSCAEFFFHLHPPSICFGLLLTLFDFQSIVIWKFIPIS